MSAAVDYLRQRGFRARVRGQRILISPWSKMTDDVRSFVLQHRLELISELAANDGKGRKQFREVFRKGIHVCRIAGEPMTQDEAREAAQLIWPDAEVS